MKILAEVSLHMMPRLEKVLDAPTHRGFGIDGIFDRLIALEYNRLFPAKETRPSDESPS
jgi:hypothetical protein